MKTNTVRLTMEWSTYYGTGATPYLIWSGVINPSDIDTAISVMFRDVWNSSSCYYTVRLEVNDVVVRSANNFALAEFRTFLRDLALEVRAGKYHTPSSEEMEMALVARQPFMVTVVKHDKEDDSEILFSATTIAANESHAILLAARKIPKSISDSDLARVEVIVNPLRK